jgi:hypothetical protein
MLSNAIMNSVTVGFASTRQGYLVELGRYLDQQGPADRPAARKAV